MSATAPGIPGRGPTGSLALLTYLISGASGSFRAEVPRPDSRACSVPFPLLSALGLTLPPGSPWFFLWLLSCSLLSLLLPWVTAGFHSEPGLLLLPYRVVAEPHLPPRSLCGCPESHPVIPHPQRGSPRRAQRSGSDSIRLHFEPPGAQGPWTHSHWRPNPVTVNTTSTLGSPASLYAPSDCQM